MLKKKNKNYSRVLNNLGTPALDYKGYLRIKIATFDFSPSNCANSNTWKG